MSHAHHSRMLEDGDSTRKAAVLPFGIREIDQRLPAGGLTYGALHEVAGGGAGTVQPSVPPLTTHFGRNSEPCSPCRRRAQ